MSVATTDLWGMRATDLAEAIRSKQASSREVVEAHLRRIEEVNPAVNAVTVVLGEQALEAAEAADRAVVGGADLPPFHGVPFTVGGLAAAVYLIDSRGLVTFCGTWGQAPALRQAIDDLLSRGGLGAPAGKGTDRRPHLAAAIVAGQGGPLRGGRQALLDLELGFPGGNILMAVGRVARPLVAPLALRTTPVPTRTRACLLIGLVGAGVGIALALCRRRQEKGAHT
jgi:hypothetical protein